MRDRGLSEGLVRRAAAAGARAVVLTVDTPYVGRKSKVAGVRFSVPDDEYLVNVAQHLLPGALGGESAEHDPSAGPYVIGRLVDVSGAPTRWSRFSWVRTPSWSGARCYGPWRGGDALAHRVPVAVGNRKVGRGAYKACYRGGTVLHDRPDVPVADIPVVILCGGMGTRLREASEQLPKPLVDIGGRPVLWHIMKTYSHFGFRRFVLCLGYKGDMIKDYFIDHRARRNDFTLRLRGDHDLEFHTAVEEEDWEITFAETGLTTATGARIARVAQYLGAPQFALTYGDGIGAVDIPAILKAHRASCKLGTLTGVHPSGRYGEMVLEGDDVTQFNEKQSQTGYVNGGFFFFEREFVDQYLDPEATDQMLEHAPLQRLARDGQLGVHRHEGFWMGMDTFRDWKELNGLWDSGQAEWKVWTD